MLGLILKDFIQMKRILKTLAGLMVLYMILALQQDSSELLITLGVVVCIIICINTLSMDERGKWNEYALTLPFTRSQLVISKYIMTCIMALIMALMAMIVEFFLSGELLAILETGVAAAVSSLLGVALVLPFLYKFGIERGRYVLMIVVMAPFVLAVVLQRTGANMSASFWSDLAQKIEHAPWILVVAIILMFACSMMISILICKKKEY